MQVHSDIPFGVKYCRIINMLYMVVFVLAGLTLSALFVSYYMQAAPQGRASVSPVWIYGAGIIFLVMGITIAYLLKMLNDALKETEERARHIQIVVSCAMLVVGFPVGTLLYGVSLYFMLADAATKDAFS